MFKLGQIVKFKQYHDYELGQILVVEESANQIRYVVKCIREGDKYNRYTELGFVKKTGKWKTTYSSILGGKFWGDLPIAPKLHKLAGRDVSEYNLFNNEEPDRDD